jgi:NADH-quinone oxidoreductase subunit L
MTGPLLALAVGAAAVGLLGSPWLGHPFQDFFGSVPGAVPVPGTDFHGEAPHWLETASVLIASAGIALALVRYGLGWQLLPEGLRMGLRPFYRLAAGKYFVDEFYELALLRPIRWFSGALFGFDARVVDGAVNGAGSAGLRLSRVKRWVDEHWVDGAVNGAAWSAGQAGGVLRLLQTGLVQNYLLVASAGALAIFLFLR